MKEFYKKIAYFYVWKWNSYPNFNNSELTADYSLQNFDKRSLLSLI